MAQSDCSCFSELSKWLRPSQHEEGNDAQHLLQGKSLILLSAYRDFEAFLVEVEIPKCNNANLRPQKF
ncbi:hypothetical protein B9Z55_027918 [Caenorhabditis nigoni]|uniref:Uncharacterized protein n=1 Tax=Caenorhabditis nigoni TaxID=1611254 RepID=A0A2G5SDX5_9PELO|nr:hypothetical protein B9Z55_027918 [Caenorhabditis nigoni]